MAMTRLPLLLLLFGAALLGCSKNDAPDSGSSDGATEAGQSDSSLILDGTADAVRADVPTSDVAFDAATSPFGGAWEAIPGVPSYCADMVSTTPSVAIPKWTWAPCASGRKGCQRLVTDWGAATNGKLLDFPWVEPVRLVGGKAYLSYLQIWPGKVGELWNWVSAVVRDLNGDPIFATRAGHDPNACTIVPKVGEAGIGLSGLSSTPLVPFVSWSSWSSPTTFVDALTAPPSDFGLGSTGVQQYVTVGSRAMFAENHHPDSIMLFDLVAHAAVKPPKPVAAELITPVHGGAYALTTDGVIFLDEGGAFNVIAKAEGTRYISRVAADRSAGDSLVWVEVDNDVDWTNATLWTSPYASSSGALARRKVAMLTETPATGGDDLVVNVGMALDVLSRDAVRLTRLSDGAGWTIHPEPGDVAAYALWVDVDEVWFATQVASIKGNANPSGITRIRRDSLGPPDLGPGF